jgi:hypothetical protein
MRHGWDSRVAQTSDKHFRRRGLYHDRYFPDHNYGQTRIAHTKCELVDKMLKVEMVLMVGKETGELRRVQSCPVAVSVWLLPIRSGTSVDGIP